LSGCGLLSLELGAFRLLTSRQAIGDMPVLRPTLAG
jgi:hypothetical protein